MDEKYAQIIKNYTKSNLGKIKLTPKDIENWSSLPESEKEKIQKTHLENSQRMVETFKTFESEFSNEIKIVDATLVKRLIELCEKYKSPYDETQLAALVSTVMEQYTNGPDNLFFYILTRPEINSSDKMTFMNFIKTRVADLPDKFFKQDNFENVVKFRDQDGNNILASVLCNENIDSKTKLMFSKFLFKLKLTDLFTFKNTQVGSKYNGYNVGVCPEKIRLSNQDNFDSEDESDSEGESDINEDLNAIKLNQFLENAILNISGTTGKLDFKRAINTALGKNKVTLSKLSLSKLPSNMPSSLPSNMLSGRSDLTSSSSGSSGSNSSTVSSGSNSSTVSSGSNSSTVSSGSNSSSGSDVNDEDVVGNFIRKGFRNALRLHQINENVSDRTRELAQPKNIKGNDNLDAVPKFSTKIKPTDQNSRITSKKTVVPLGGGKRRNTKKKRKTRRRRHRRQ